jgi:putative sterol carrier protein
MARRTQPCRAPLQESIDAIGAAAIDPAEFANMVCAASDEQLEASLFTSRELILGEIFRRIEDHFDPWKAEGVEGVIHWKITGREDGGYDHYQVVIREGTCKVERDGTEDPRTTFEVHAVSFVRLVAGHAAGMRLFLSGSLRIDGDKRFALKAQRCFRFPKPGAVEQAA